MLRWMGVQQFFIDSDGNAAGMIPEFVACGVTGVHPCEVNAGMDVGALREAFPALNLNGGIDKRALAQGREAIDAELERCFRVAWSKGRYTPALDHGAPPDISWDNVRYYADRYREHCPEAELAGCATTSQRASRKNRLLIIPHAVWSVGPFMGLALGMQRCIVRRG